jgi:hypothetical protein
MRTSSSLVATIVILAAVAAPAHAGKPSSRAAIAAAKGGRTAMNAENAPAAVDAAVAQTGTPFWYGPRPPISDGDAADACTSLAPGPLADAAAIRALLACVLEHGGLIDDLAYGEPRFQVVSAAKVPAPLRAGNKKALAAAARDHVLVLETVSIPAPATEWALYVVAPTADGQARVDGVLRAGRDDSAALFAPKGHKP